MAKSPPKPKTRVMAKSPCYQIPVLGNVSGLGLSLDAGCWWGGDQRRVVEKEGRGAKPDQDCGRARYGPLLDLDNHAREVICQTCPGPKSSGSICYKPRRVAAQKGVKDREG